MVYSKDTPIALRNKHFELRQQYLRDTMVLKANRLGELDVPLTEEQKAELDARTDAYLAWVDENMPPYK